jgi:hypothetical protein
MNKNLTGIDLPNGDSEWEELVYTDSMYDAGTCITIKYIGLWNGRAWLVKTKQASGQRSAGFV